MDVKIDSQDIANKASEASCVDEGMAVAETILALPGASACEEAQICYVMALTNLSSRATPEQAEEILRRLLSSRVYQKQANAQAHHASALLHAAKNTRPWAQGAALAGLFNRLPMYSESPHLQLLHAQALFNVSVITENAEETVRLAEKLKAIPAYASAGEIQFECAKMLSNAIAWATSENILKECVAWIASMPGRNHYPPLAEAFARAERNVYRKISGQAVPQTIPIGKAKTGLMERLRGFKEREFVVGVAFKGPEELPPLELQVTATGEKPAQDASRAFVDKFLREKNMVGTFRYDIIYCRPQATGKENVDMGKGAVVPASSPRQNNGTYRIGIEFDGPDFDFPQVMDLTIKAGSSQEARTRGVAVAKELADRMQARGMDIRSCRIVDITAV